MGYAVISLPTLYLASAHGDGPIAKGIRAGMRAVGVDGVAEIRKAITDTSPRAPIDTGLLRNSITAAYDADGLGVYLGPAPPAAERGAVMELGRRPNGKLPPIDPIFQWVHRKGLATRFLMGRRLMETRERSRLRKVSRGGARLSIGKKAIRRDLELDLAFAIRRSIAKKGIRPRKFMERALRVIRPRAPWLINMGITNALRAAPGGTMEV